MIAEKYFNTPQFDTVFDLEFLTDFSEFEFDDMTIHDIEQLCPSLEIGDFDGRIEVNQVVKCNAQENSYEGSVPPMTATMSPKRQCLDTQLAIKQKSKKRPSVEISTVNDGEYSHRINDINSDTVVHVVSDESPACSKLATPDIAISESHTNSTVKEDISMISIGDSSRIISKDDVSKTSDSKVAAMEGPPIKERPPPSITKKNTDDALIGYTYKLIKAFNFGDLSECYNIIDRFCALNMLVRTPFSSADLCGRHHFKEIHASMLADRPDTVYEVKYSKLLRDKRSDERYLAIKLEFSQTRCGFTSDKLDKIDEVYRPELLTALKADTTIEERQRAFVDHKIPYSAKGIKWLRYSIAENNELLDCSITRKFTLVEPFDITDV